jgi:hypothetical protein
MAEWATTFVSTAPEEVTETFASTVEAAVDTEVKEEQIKNHLLQDQSVVLVGLTEHQAKVVTTSFKGLAETMQAEMLATLRKELGLGVKEAVRKEAEVSPGGLKKQDEGGAYTLVGKGGCKAGQTSTSSNRRADANSMINDLPERSAAVKRAGDDDDLQIAEQESIAVRNAERDAAATAAAEHFHRTGEEVELDDV